MLSYSCEALRGSTRRFLGVVMLGYYSWRYSPSEAVRGRQRPATLGSPSRGRQPGPVWPGASLGGAARAGGQQDPGQHQGQPG